jgi:hypothetical protein
MHGAARTDLKTCRIALAEGPIWTPCGMNSAFRTRGWGSWKTCSGGFFGPLYRQTTAQRACELASRSQCNADCSVSDSLSAPVVCMAERPLFSDFFESPLALLQCFVLDWELCTKKRPCTCHRFSSNIWSLIRCFPSAPAQRNREPFASAFSAGKPTASCACCRCLTVLVNSILVGIVDPCPHLVILLVILIQVLSSLIICTNGLEPSTSVRPISNQN